MTQSLFHGALLAAVLSLAPLSPVWAQAPDTLSLNGAWSFALAKDAREADALGAVFFDPKYTASRFQATPVPSNWAVQGFEDPHYKPFKEEASQGFYIEHFTLPPGWDARRVVLHFGGVWSSAEVWLNGAPLGRHDSGFTNFAYDVTSKLNYSGDNVLAVRVRQTQHDYLFDTNDDWSLGGIYRDVTLETMPKGRWLDRVDVQTVFDAQYSDADLKVRVMVGDAHRSDVPGNLPGGGQAYDLRLTLLDGNGQTVARQQTTTPGHDKTDRETAVVLHVTKPQHWTAETPSLYTLRTEILEQGVVTHTRTRRVGFRQISTDGGVFRINGQPVKLRGVDRHDEYPDVGRATTPDIWRKDIQLMKAANINFVRMSHYPPAEGFLDLCDEMGLYVEDEVPMGFGGDSANDPSYASAVMLRSYETVERDLNHPSIIVWSIGNEDPLTSLHMASVRTVKALDPTRPVLLPWRAEDWLPPEIDIQAPHYFTAQRFDDLAAHATRPIITSEYSHAYGEDGFGDLDLRWQAIMRHPSAAGGAIWMWADQGIKSTTRNADGTLSSKLVVVPDGWDGITDSYRHPTHDYWETQAVYAQVYPATSRIDITPGQASVSLPIRNDFDFTDLSDVRIGWTLYEDGRVLSKGKLTTAGQPHATTNVDLPLTALRRVRPGATYYVQLVFSHPDGTEITRRAVELAPTAAPVTRPVIKVAVTPDDGGATIRAGRVTYRFNRSGSLLTIKSQGQAVVSDLRPAIWRPLNATEMVRVSKTLLPQLPDLNTYTATVRDFSATPTADGVVVRAAVSYAVDDKNHFDVAYTFSIGADGGMTVDYVVTPVVLAEWLPFVGVALTTPPAFTHVRWLGLGPYDAFPNETVAPYLGVWSNGDAVTAKGVKSARWAVIAPASGRGLRIEAPGSIAFDAATPGQLKVLSSVAGRPTKFGLAELPEQQLKTGEGTTFSGRFVLRPDDGL